MSKPPAASPSRPSPVEDWGVVMVGYAVMAIAALALIGWGLRIGIFVTALPGLAPMMASTALGLALLGVAVVFVGLGRASHRTVKAAVAGVLAICAVVAVEHVFGREFGIDVLFGDSSFVALGNAAPRMGWNTACVLFLFAISLLFRARDSRRATKVAVVAVALAGVIALVALAGYVGRYVPGYRWGQSSGMAIHSSACALLIASVLLVDARRRLTGTSFFSSWALGLAAAGFLVLAVGWVAYRGFARLVEVGNAITRAHEVDDRVRQVQLMLAEFELRRQAYLLTGEPARLAEDGGGEKQLRTLLDELRELVADPEQRTRVQRLDGLVAETLARRRLSLLPTDPTALSRDRLSFTSADLELRAELQAVLRRLLSAEADLLLERQARGERAIIEARGVIVLGVFAVFLLGTGSVVVLRRLLRELRESQGRLASIFASIDEGLVLQDRGGRILESNAAACRILGLSAAQLSGRDSLDPRWRTVREDGSPWPGEEHPAMVALREGLPQREKVMGLHRPDGRLAWISINSEPVLDASGSVRAAVTSFFDVTARRSAELALRESEERFRSTFEHAGIGMAIVALDGRWLRVNRVLSRILGRDEAWLLEHSFRDVTHPEDLDAAIDQARGLASGSTTHYRIEKRYLHAGGAVVWVNLTVSLVRDAAGAPAYFVSQIEDITERKKAEEKLAAYAARVAEKNRELQDFAYVASHDLQEPLRKIQAFGDRLDRRASARLEAEERDYLGRMRAAAARMSGLIEALLAYSRVGSAERVSTAVPLDRALQEALQDLELRLERCGGRVEAGPLPEVRGDPVQLRQLFQNLVGNALKYHRTGVPPWVRVSSAPAPAGALPGGVDAWEIAVEDNGIGFEPRHAEAIFGVFQRLHGRDQYEGTGVGLAICRRIVERHGGSIRAEGRPGEGARFVVVLPAGRPPSPLDA